MDDYIINTTASAAATTAAINNTLHWDDATWVLIASFIIFTMQSGFGLLEAGSVSSKNEVNIMYKITMDVVFGGLAYWLFGFAFSYGNAACANSFIGCGGFLLHVEMSDQESMGSTYVQYVFQLSFGATATTIVSGAVAERIKLPVYIIYCFFNIFTYSVPVHWIWNDIGWLYERGAVDVAGSGVVHLCGGTSALVAAMMLGPRTGRYANGYDPLPVGNGANIVLGTIMLWWGWLGFNCGSTFGVQGGKWILAARSAVVTIQGAVGGGVGGVILSLIISKGKMYTVTDMCNAVLGGLVSITASCAIIHPWEGIVIGVIGGVIAIGAMRLFDRLKIDDPVGAISVHGCCGIWGMVAVGLFVADEPLHNLNNGLIGAFHGGGGYALGIQLAACASIIAWSAACTFIIFGVMNLTIGIRMLPEEEGIGADQWRHGMGGEIIVLDDYETRSGSFLGMGRHRSVTLDSQKNEETRRDRVGSSNKAFEADGNCQPGTVITSM